MQSSTRGTVAFVGGTGNRPEFGQHFSLPLVEHRVHASSSYFHTLSTQVADNAFDGPGQGDGFVCPLELQHLESTRLEDPDEGQQDRHVVR